MAETVVVETPVITALATTVVETPVVTPAATPEPDILTKVSQFKLPDNQDKIENPPDQPELAGITDPIAKKAAAEAIERMRRGMQSDYTKKLEEAQKLVNKSKSWTPQRIQQELLTNPEFVSAAQMVNGQLNNNKSVEDINAYSVLSDTEKAKVDLVPGLKAELEQMKQNAANEQIRTAINQKDLTLREKFSDYDSRSIDQACIDLGKMNLADVREYVYKATSFESSVKKAYEMGKLEGQGKLNGKLNVITPMGSTAIPESNKPIKQAGESDKNFFIRLGQHNLANFKSQK